MIHFECGKEFVSTWVSTHKLANFYDELVKDSKELDGGFCG